VGVTGPVLDWRGWQWGWSRTGFRRCVSVNPELETAVVIFTNGARGYTLWKDVAKEAVEGNHGAVDWVLPDL